MAEKSRATILGENLKRIRKEKNISRQELAAKTGITANRIGEYETGRNLPPLDKIFILADSLEVAVISLTGDNNFNPVYPDTADVDKKIFEYRLKRAKKMLEFLDGLADLLGDDALQINDQGNVTVSSYEKIIYKDGIVSAGGAHTITIFKNTEIFVDVMEKAEYRALYRQIPFSQAFTEIIAEAKQE